MNGSRVKIGVASAVAGVSLLAGGLVLGAPWASAQTPPAQPTPQQGTPQTPGTPRNNGTPGPNSTPRQGQTPGQTPGQGGGQQGDHDCPKDANGNMIRPSGGSGGSGQQNNGQPGSSRFQGGPRTLRQ